MGENSLDQGGWTIRQPPTSYTGMGRPAVDPDIPDVIAKALETGEWLAKDYPTDRAAYNAARRIRYQVRTSSPELHVATRRHGARLSIRVTKKKRKG